jgi:hypothetical protein
MNTLPCSAEQGLVLGLVQGVVQGVNASAFGYQ